MNTQIRTLETLTKTEKKIWDILQQDFNDDVTTGYHKLIENYNELDINLQHYKKRTLNVFISKMRRYKGIADIYIIETVHTIGYKLKRINK